MERSLGIQLYSLREFPGGYSAAFDAVKSIGINSVEIWSGAVPDDPDVTTSVDTLRAAVEDAGLELTCGHIAIQEFDQRYADWVAFLKAGGSSTWVIPFAKAESLEEWLALLPRFRVMAARLENDGIRLGYHNHHMELEEFGGKRVFEHLLDEMPELLAQFHISQFKPERGIHLPDWIRRYAGRVCALHVNDADAGGPCRVGAGFCAAEESIRTAIDTGVTDFILEEDVSPGNLDDVRRDVDFVRRLIG